MDTLSLKTVGTKLGGSETPQPYMVSPPQSVSHTATNTPQTSPKPSSMPSSPSAPSDDQTLVDGVAGPLAKMLDAKNLKTASTEELLSLMNFLKASVSNLTKSAEESKHQQQQDEKPLKPLSPSERTKFFETAPTHKNEEAKKTEPIGTMSDRPPSRQHSESGCCGSRNSLPHLGHGISQMLSPVEEADWSVPGSLPGIHRSSFSVEGSYRMEVESTLHKTLELDYLLTVKELRSYENLAETATVEYQRAVAAFDEAEKFAQEKRREVEIALQEKSELRSIIRYLKSRVDSLDSRLKDGAMRLSRMGVDSSHLQRVGLPLEPMRSSGSSEASMKESAGFGRLSSIPALFDSVANQAVEQSHGPLDFGIPNLFGPPESSLKRSRNSSPASDETRCFPGRESPLDLPPAVLAERSLMNSAERSSLRRPSVMGSAVIPATTAPLGMMAATPAPHDMPKAGGNAAPAQAPACIFYQGGQCSGNVCGMKSPHVCIRCNENHPVILCKKDRNVCVKWNMEDCGLGCHREHRCLRCASQDHTLRACPIRPLSAAEYCFAWNSAGTCRIVDCRRLHECIRCGTSHPAIICPENLDNYLMEYMGKCRAEGASSEQVYNMELLINRRSHLAASSRPVPLPPPGTPNTPARTGTVQPHPLHLAAAASIRSEMIQQQPSLPAEDSIFLSNAGINVNAAFGNLKAGGGMAGPFTPVLDPERAAKRIRSEDPHAMILTGFRTSHGSLLSDSERKMICRDYNNFKCEVDDSRCRFKHACLRCGMTDHRERNCLVVDN
ncbi:hypothetical protein HDU96_005713 [Phlyctochytrium bullatum]|nr:hypothetical protein HDU96_005713 [Phlyctochytrium bullatum]